MSFIAAYHSPSEVFFRFKASERPARPVIVFASRRHADRKSSISRSSGVRSPSELADEEDELEEVLISDLERESFGGVGLRFAAFLAGAVLVLDMVGFGGADFAGAFDGAAFEDEAAGFDDVAFGDFSDFDDLSDFSDFGDDFSALEGLSTFCGEGAGVDTGDDPGNAPIKLATLLVVGVGFGGSCFAGAFEAVGFVGSAFEDDAFAGVAVLGGAPLVGSVLAGSVFLGGALAGGLFSGTTGAGGVAGVEEPPPRKAAARSRTLMVGTWNIVTGQGRDSVELIRIGYREGLAVWNWNGWRDQSITQNVGGDMDIEAVECYASRGTTDFLCPPGTHPSASTNMRPNTPN